MDRFQKETILDKVDFKIIVRRPAEVEILEAFIWYEEQQIGVGFEFLTAIDTAMLSVIKNPSAYQIVHKDIHRVLLRKFPYALFYVIEDKRIIFLACFHQRRDLKDF